MTCGGGTKRRQRHLETPPLHAGEKYPPAIYIRSTSNSVPKQYSYFNKIWKPFGQILPYCMIFYQIIINLPVEFVNFVKLVHVCQKFGKFDNFATKSTKI